jgi:hypothetical protein
MWHSAVSTIGLWPVRHSLLLRPSNLRAPLASGTGAGQQTQNADVVGLVHGEEEDEARLGSNLDELCPNLLMCLGTERVSLQLVDELGHDLVVRDRSTPSSHSKMMPHHH